LFAEHAVWEASVGVELRFAGRDAIVGALKSMLSSLDFLFQTNGAVVIELDGDHAQGRVSLSEIGRDSEGRGIHNHGMSFDDLAKLDGQWLFMRRGFRVRHLGGSVSGTVFALTPGSPRLRCRVPPDYWNQFLSPARTQNKRTRATAQQMNDSPIFFVNSMA
jgi:hypothetical protein